MNRIVKNIKNDIFVTNSASLNDARLGIAERGMLMTLLSIPRGSNVDLTAFHKMLPADGKAKINTALNRLERAGYIRRSSNGDYEISSIPCSEWIEEQAERV